MDLDGPRVAGKHPYFLDGGWVGQNKFERRSHCKKRTK